LNFLNSNYSIDFKTQNYTDKNVRGAGICTDCAENTDKMLDEPDREIYCK
jgi:hypothetical protein